jgi:hypothetical protein
MIIGRPGNAERVSTAFARYPEQSPTWLVFDGSAARGGGFDHPFRLMVPEDQLAITHFNHNCSAISAFDETIGSGYVLVVFQPLSHLNPMGIVAGLE